MKKFLIALLAALLVVGMMSVAYATSTGELEDLDRTAQATTGVEQGDHIEAGTVEAHTHSFTKPTYFGDCDSRMVIMTCACGEQDPAGPQKAPADHVWGEDIWDTKATCTTPGAGHHTCVKCGKTEKFVVSADDGHDWTAWQVETAKTCTLPGTDVRMCRICGKVEKKPTNPTGKHIFDMSAATTNVIDRASCENPGYYEAKCTLCGLYFTGKDAKDATDGRAVLYIAPRGHKFDNGKVTKTVTCQADGEIVYTCTHTAGTIEYTPCAFTKTVTLKKTDTEYRPEVGKVTSKYHAWKWIKTATIEGVEVGYYKCTVAGCTEQSSTQMQKLATPAASGTSKSSSSSSSSSHKSSSSTGKKGVSIPATNDTTSNLPYVLIAVAFVGLVAMVASKRKVHG